MNATVTADVLNGGESPTALAQQVATTVEKILRWHLALGLLYDHTKERSLRGSCHETAASLVQLASKLRGDQRVDWRGLTAESVAEAWSHVPALLEAYKVAWRNELGMYQVLGDSQNARWAEGSDNLACGRFVTLVELLLDAKRRRNVSVLSEALEKAWEALLAI